MQKLDQMISVSLSDSETAGLTTEGESIDQGQIRTQSHTGASNRGHVTQGMGHRAMGRLGDYDNLPLGRLQCSDSRASLPLWASGTHVQRHTSNSAMDW